MVNVKDVALFFFFFFSFEVSQRSSGLLYKGAFSKQCTVFGSAVISNRVYVSLYIRSGEDITSYYVCMLSDSRLSFNSRLFY